MSEMSAEKKKEIEKYIIKSYFGGGKNVESLANGADVIKGTDDGYIPQLLVEVTYFGESGIVMIRWNVYGDSQQNSFSMHICREREIEQNRCDSVDSMMYAWEAWRAKIQGKPVFLKTNDEDLQKDKRIEELERTVKALKAEKEVMERHIQELESHNVSLAETNAVLNNKLNKFDPMPEFKELLKKLYSTDDVETLTWTLNHVCGGRGSVNGWIAVSLFWKQNYETLSKLVGFSSVEEIQDYLTNEAECDTLREAMLKLIDENKYVCEEWCKAGELIEKWRKATGFSSPEDYEGGWQKIRRLCENIYKSNDNGEREQEWKDATGCVTPDQAKSRIEGLENAVRLTDRTMIKELDQEIDKWKKATGCDTPEMAKERLGGFIQAASCAEKHLEHILLWRPEQTGQEVE